MEISVIGKNIAALRREKGARQEDLAACVGVSAQAVSKWENGGVPDPELLPKIADYFSVSIDSLFDRDFDGGQKVGDVLIRKMIDLPEEERFDFAFDRCWEMERAFFGVVPTDGDVKTHLDVIDENEQTYSSVLTDHGFTRMGVGNRIQYFMLVKDIQNADRALFNNIDYTEFFKDFSDKDVFGAFVLLSRRDHKKAFTPALLMKNMKLTHDRATKILSVLEKYQLIKITQIELDDEIQTVYTFKPSPSLVSALILVREVISPPNRYSWHFGQRKKPYLQ